MSVTVDYSGFVRTGEDGACRLDLALDGVTCAACIGEIEQAMMRTPGVHARLNYTNSRLALSWRADASARAPSDGRDAGEAAAASVGDAAENARFSPSAAVETLRVMGYRAYPFELAEAESRDEEHAKYLMRCLAVAGFAAMNIMLLSVSVWAGNASDITPETRDMFHWLSAVIAIPAAAFAGRPFFVSAFHAVKRGSLNMDVPISLGVILALGMSLVETALSNHHAYFDSALMLLFFLLTGRYMEQAMRRRTRAVAGNLAALRAPVASRIEPDGSVVQTPTSRLAVGDIILIKPGERAPADGVVIAGASEIDESIVTGETQRRPVRDGAMLYSGSMNFSGALRVRVSAAGEGSFLSEIERLLEKAGAERSGYVGLAERASRIYAPVVHLTALTTCLGWIVAGASIHDSIIIAIAVLIITCPCALALAVPAVHVVASGGLFRAGVLLNGGDAIERLAEADAVVFDKTGTLTLPEARAANASAYAPAVVEMAARLARSSHHPLARALAFSAPHGAPFDGAQESAGEGVRALIDGVEARLGSAAFCGCDEGEEASASSIYFRYGAERARFLIRQTLRPDAADVAAGLVRAGYAVEIVSGDAEPATRAIAEALGGVRFMARARPADKVARLAQLRAEGRRPAMVGDGFNDAPALAAAHVSLSPITAADVAQASADAVFLGDKLGPVAQSLAIARRARGLMRQNLAIAVIYNAIAVPLAIAGWVTPLIAALAMSGSSLIVTANALRAAPRHKDALPLRQTSGAAADANYEAAA